MQIIYSILPSNFPTSIKDPGNWIRNIDVNKYSIDIFNINKEFWDKIFDNKILDLFKKDNKSNVMKEDINKTLEALNSYKVYESLEEYNYNIKIISKYLNIINSLQEEFVLDFISGIIIKTLDVSRLKNIIEYSKKDTLLKYIMEKTLENKYVDNEETLLLLEINSIQELIAASVLVDILRKRNPNLYTCVMGMGYENFSFNHFGYDEMRKNGFFSVFNSIIKYTDQKDIIIQALIGELESGIRREGFIELKEYDIKNNQIDEFKFPYIKVFSAETILSMRLLGSACYWGKCVFCTQHTKNMIKKTNNQYVNEIINKLKYYINCGYKYFYFTDEALSPNFLFKLSNEIISEGLKIKWICRCRLEKEFTTEVLTALKEAGCHEILYGLESISPRVLKLMNKYKNIPDSNDIKGILNNTYKAKINMHITLIIGFPGEMVEDVENTIEFITNNLYHIPNVTYWINKYAVFNNSVVKENASRFGIDIYDNEGDLTYINKFKYVEGPYINETLLNNLVKTIRGKLYKFSGWGEYGYNNETINSMLLYSFSSHGVLIKERNKILPVR